MTRPVDYLAALRAMNTLRHGYDDRAAMAFKEALDGGDADASLAACLAEPDSGRLIAQRPDLTARLDDWEALAALPAGTLGSAYRSLAVRDCIRVRDLVEADRKHRSAESEVQEWLRARLIGSHDLLHVLTGYERDKPGEMLLIAFTHGCVPKRIFRVILVFGLLGVPPRHLPRFLVDLRRAWRRGRDAIIPRSTRWERLLALPLDDARSRLGIAATASTHSGRIWREEPSSGAWKRVTLATP